MKWLILAPVKMREDTLTRYVLWLWLKPTPLRVIEGESMNERRGRETAVFKSSVELENLGLAQVVAIRGGLEGMFAVWGGTRSRTEVSLWQLPGEVRVIFFPRKFCWDLNFGARQREAFLESEPLKSWTCLKPWQGWILENLWLEDLKPAGD